MASHLKYTAKILKDHRATQPVLISFTTLVYNGNAFFCVRVHTKYRRTDSPFETITTNKLANFSSECRNSDSISSAHSLTMNWPSIHHCTYQPCTLSTRYTRHHHPTSLTPYHAKTDTYKYSFFLVPCLSGTSLLSYTRHILYNPGWFHWWFQCKARCLYFDSLAVFIVVWYSGALLPWPQTWSALCTKWIDKTKGI